MLAKKTIQGADIPMVWKQALAYVHEEGTLVFDNRGETKEVMNLTTTVTSPKDQLPPEIVDKVKRANQYELLDALVNRESPWAPSRRIWRWDFRGYGSYDQIEAVVSKLVALKTDPRRSPDTRRAVVNLYVPPVDHNATSTHSPPAILSIDFKLRGERLHLVAFLRSSELFLWWPVNAVQLYRLVKLVAERLRCEVGSLTLISSSSHIRKEDMKDVAKIISGIGKV